MRQREKDREKKRDKESWIYRKKYYPIIINLFIN